MKADIQKEDMDYTEYIGWIMSIRSKYNLPQEEFGKKICHFVQKNGEEVCVFCHRNTIRNWESGRSIPLSVETFVSLALVDYSGSCSKVVDMSLSKRRERYRYVKKMMMKYWGRSLYCRNINDALLIEAIRGIFSMEELPEIRREMNKIIEDVTLELEEKKQYSIEKMTENLEASLMKVETKEDFIEVVKSNKIFFYLGNRTVGERIVKMYETSENTPKDLDFKEAVLLYAPKYMDSYGKIFSSDINVSRSWLLDFCIHMRFSRKEINEVLDNAGMMKLVNTKKSVEYYIRESGKTSIGSVKWYENKAFNNIYGFDIRYNDIKNLSLQYKLAFLTLTACSLCGEDQILRRVPLDYFLEYFVQKEEGRQILENMRNILKKYTEKVKHNTKGVFENHVADLHCIIENIVQNLKYNFENKFLCEYKDEFSRYFNVPQSKYSGKTALEYANKIRFFACVSYSVITGKLYTGNIDENDFKTLEYELVGIENKNEKMRKSYYFMSLLWTMFLGSEKIHWDFEEGFYIVREDNKNTMVIDMKEILEDITAIWCISEEL